MRRALRSTGRDTGLGSGKRFFKIRGSGEVHRRILRQSSMGSEGERGNVAVSVIELEAYWEVVASSSRNVDSTRMSFE